MMVLWRARLAACVKWSVVHVVNRLPTMALSSRRLTPRLLPIHLSRWTVSTRKSKRLVISAAMVCPGRTQSALHTHLIVCSISLCLPCSMVYNTSPFFSGPRRRLISAPTTPVVLFLHLFSRVLLLTIPPLCSTWHCRRVEHRSASGGWFPPRNAFVCLDAWDVGDSLHDAARRRPSVRSSLAGA